MALLKDNSGECAGGLVNGLFRAHCWEMCRSADVRVRLFCPLQLLAAPPPSPREWIKDFGDLLRVKTILPVHVVEANFHLYCFT
jgi:hypothetical protein